MPYVVLAFFGFILWALTTQSDTLQALLITPLWFIGLAIGYGVIRRSPRHAQLRALHVKKVVAEREEAGAFRIHGPRVEDTMESETHSV